MYWVIEVKARPRMYLDRHGSREDLSTKITDVTIHRRRRPRPPSPSLSRSLLFLPLSLFLSLPLCLSVSPRSLSSVFETRRYLEMNLPMGNPGEIQRGEWIFNVALATVGGTSERALRDVNFSSVERRCSRRRAVSLPREGHRRARARQRVESLFRLRFISPTLPECTEQSPTRPMLTLRENFRPI